MGEVGTKSHPVPATSWSGHRGSDRELLCPGVGKGHAGGGMRALYTHKGHPKLAQPNQRCFLLRNHVPEFLLLQVGTFFVSQRRAGAFTRGTLAFVLSGVSMLYLADVGSGAVYSSPVYRGGRS